MRVPQHVGAESNFQQLARRNAPPAAENTEKSSGALNPKAAAIVIANVVRRIPAPHAATRVCHPTIRQRPNKTSAQVAMMAKAGIIALGKNQLSVAVYATNRGKLPQETLGWPKPPHNPRRSATAERNEVPRAIRRKSELNSSARYIARLWTPLALRCSVLSAGSPARRRSGPRFTGYIRFSLFFGW